MPHRVRNYSGPNTLNQDQHGNWGRRRHHTHNADQNREQPQEQRQNQSHRGRNRRGRRDQNNQNCTAYESSQQSTMVPELPGMYYDPITGYTQSDINARRTKENLLRNVEANRQAIQSRSGVKSLAVLQSSLQTNGRKMNSVVLKRRIAESRLMNIKSIPHSIHTIENTINYEPLTACKFIQPATDGRSFFGCWSSQRFAFTNCMRVSVDPELKEKAFFALERDENALVNTMGLKMEMSAIEQDSITDPEVVDMCIAPIDAEVTGCLYVTAKTRYERNQLRSSCSVVLNPVPDWCDPENFSTLGSPIYNIYMSDSAHIWSCGWSPNNMYISLGMEESARICNIVTDQRFHISSKGQNVVCQSFTADGNIIIMGLQRRKIMCSDLRMPNKHCIDEENDWPRTKNSCFVQPLKNQYPDHVLTQSFDGHLKLWDLRNKTAPVLEYRGHRNRGYKLSCTVDADERFVFAVGADGCTRGWSISSGELLCELPSPQELTENSEYPRIAFSDTWGGDVGNTALVISNGSGINVHQLDL